MLPAILFALLQAADAAQKPVTELPPLVPSISDISPNGKFLAIATRGDGVWVIEIGTAVRKSRIAISVEGVQNLAWSPNSALLSLQHKDHLDLYDAATGQLRSRCSFKASVTDGNYDEVRIAFVPDSSAVVIAGTDETTEVFSTSEGLRKGLIELPKGTRTSALAVHWKDDLVALGTHTGQVSVWKLADLHSPVLTVDVPSRHEARRIHALAFDAQGQRIAIGGSDCFAREWTLATGTLCEFDLCDEDVFDKNRIGCVEFSPDGTRLLAVTFYDHWVAGVWDAQSQTRLFTHDYGGGNPWPARAGFAVDGQCIVIPGHGVTAVAGAAANAKMGIEGIDHRQPSIGGFKQDLEWNASKDMLLVRKLPQLTTVLKLPVREK